MKRSLSLLALAVAFTLVLAALPTAPAAQAIIPCSLCEADQNPNDRCIGACNGIFTLFCGDYWFLGCGPAPFLQEEDEKQAFLDTLTEETLDEFTTGDGDEDDTSPPGSN
ncbi:MAG: hypothetical protein AAGD01_13870 [Acidobacteriota bacterium]